MPCQRISTALARILRYWGSSLELQAPNVLLGDSDDKRRLIDLVRTAKGGDHGARDATRSRARRKRLVDDECHARCGARLASLLRLRYVSSELRGQAPRYSNSFDERRTARARIG